MCVATSKRIGLLHKEVFPLSWNAADDESIARSVAEDMLHLQLISQLFEK